MEVHDWRCLLLLLSGSALCVAASAGSKGALPFYTLFYFLAKNPQKPPNRAYFTFYISKYGSFHFLLLRCAYIMRSWKNYILAALSFYLCCSVQKVTEYKALWEPHHQKYDIPIEEGEDNLKILESNWNIWVFQTSHFAPLFFWSTIILVIHKLKRLTTKDEKDWQQKIKEKNNINTGTYLSSLWIMSVFMLFPPSSPVRYAKF